MQWQDEVETSQIVSTALTPEPKRLSTPKPKAHVPISHTKWNGGSRDRQSPPFFRPLDLVRVIVRLTRKSGNQEQA
eukprot:5764315-Amphidinium_carterae.1